MYQTVTVLTASSLLGKRRALFLFVLPGLLLALAILVRVFVGDSPSATIGLLQGFAMAPVVPLLGLLIGTGVIGSEIDDGSIIYLLSKPIPRSMIVLTKFVVAVVTLLVLAALPTLIAGMIVIGSTESIALGYFQAALVGGIAYAALFMALAVISRHAVIIGLIYALVWESLVGGLVPGAQSISIQQWALALGAETAVEGRIDAAVSTGTGVILLVLITAGSLALASIRLRSLTLVEAE